MSRLIMIAFVILVVCGAVLATTGVLQRPQHQGRNRHHDRQEED